MQLTKTRVRKTTDVHKALRFLFPSQIQHMLSTTFYTSSYLSVKLVTKGYPNVFAKNTSISM